MTEYLKLDSTRVSYGEYWRWKPGPTFLVVAALKLIRLRLPTTLLVPVKADIELIDPATRPPELTEMLEKPVRACQERGYEFKFWYGLPALGAVIAMGAALVSGDGHTVAGAVAGQSRDGLNREVHLGLATRLRAGKILVTGDGESLFDPAPEIEPQRLRGRSYAELLDAHAAQVSTRRVDVIAVSDPLELVRRLEQVEIDANVARGIYVPATPDDVASVIEKDNG